MKRKKEDQLQQQIPEKSSLKWVISIATVVASLGVSLGINVGDVAARGKTHPARNEATKVKGVQSNQDATVQANQGKWKGIESTQGKHKDVQSTQGKLKGIESTQGKHKDIQSTQGKLKGIESTQGKHKDIQSDQVK